MLGIEHLRSVHENEMALVVGNSPWRTGFPIHQWHGPVIVCNGAFLELPCKGYVCISDVEMMRQAFAEPEAVEHTFITPTDIGKADLRHLIDSRGLKHVGVEGAWDTAPTSGAMAIGLAGWLGCKSILIIGFSCDQSHISRNDRVANPGSNVRGIESLKSGIKEYGRLSPGGHVSISVDPDWFTSAIEETQWLRR